LVVVLAFVAGPLLSLLLATLPNRLADLTWRGTLREPARTGVPTGARCLLRVRPNVQFHEVLVGAWQVSVRCGAETLLRDDDACCLDEKDTQCALAQTRRLGAAWYAVECRQRGLVIDSAAQQLYVGDARIEIDSESAPVVDDVLFEEDGHHRGFREYATD
jgi:hypothetical protein